MQSFALQALQPVDTYSLHLVWSGVYGGDITCTSSIVWYACNSRWNSHSEDMCDSGRQFLFLGVKKTVVSCTHGGYLMYTQMPLIYHLVYRVITACSWNLGKSARLMVLSARCQAKYCRMYQSLPSIGLQLPKNCNLIPRRYKNILRYINTVLEVVGKLKPIHRLPQVMAIAVVRPFSLSSSVVHVAFSPSTEWWAVSVSILWSWACQEVQNDLVFAILCSPYVEFCGYSIPHPTDNLVNLRIQTTGEVPSYGLFGLQLDQTIRIRDLSQTIAQWDLHCLCLCFAGSWKCWHAR